MTLVYRSMFATESNDLLPGVTTEFTTWLQSKGIDASASDSRSWNQEGHAADGTAWGASGFLTRSAPGGNQALLLRLTEDKVDGQCWRTTILSASGRQSSEVVAQRGWIALDLDRTGADDDELPGSPRIVRSLITKFEGKGGSVPLAIEPVLLGASDVHQYVDLIFDPRRQVPMMVFSASATSTQSGARFCRELARDVAGVGVVLRLSSDAEASFAEAVGRELMVPTGAMRTYRPHIARYEPQPARHRILGGASIRALGPRASLVVRRDVLRWAVSRQLEADMRATHIALTQQNLRDEVRVAGADGAAVGPDATEADAVVNGMLRNFLRSAGVDVATIPAVAPSAGRLLFAAERSRLRNALLRKTREVIGAASSVVDSSEVEALRGLLAESEGLRQLQEDDLALLPRLRGQVDDLELERVADIESLDGALREIDRLEARSRWLDGELRRAGQYAVYEADIEDTITADIQSVSDVLDIAPDVLTYVRLCASPDVAAELDVHPRKAEWAARMWRALRVMNSYARHRVEHEWNGNFRDWCGNPGAGLTLPPNQVALQESESTMNQFGETRRFSVPSDVAPAGSLLMPAHIKILSPERPYPRMHFYDDVQRSGMMIVGYVGDHLPTASGA